MYSRLLRFMTSMIFGSSGLPSVTTHGYPPLGVLAGADPSVYIVQLAFVSLIRAYAVAEASSLLFLPFSLLWAIRWSDGVHKHAILFFVCVGSPFKVGT